MHPSRAIRMTPLSEVPHMVIKPSTTALVAQRGVNPTLLRIVPHGWALIVLCVALCGCNSIYHRTWATMPPDAQERLELRMKEARVVERSAHEAAGKLLALLQQGGEGDRTRVGFDRLEKESLELNRKILAVRDELGAGVEAHENRQLEELSNQARTWHRFAVENRSADSRVAARQLEHLFVQR